MRWMGMFEVLQATGNDNLLDPSDPSSDRYPTRALPLCPVM
jgi:hypothetical protein